MADYTIDEGFNPQTGVRTRVHFEDGQIIHQKTFDAEPYLKAAAEARAKTAGQGWGNGRVIGTLPPLMLAKVQQIADPDERDKAIMAFFRENPKFVKFDRALL
jgi:hypothetical protein